MSCDLKISLGAMMPHFGYGFGGGSKMLLPGVAGIDSITHNHKIMEGTGPGQVVENIRRLDSEEAARMAGLDFVINGFMNSDSDVSGLVCGDLVEAHREGVEYARKHYATEIIEDADIVIGNGYPMANEGYKAYHILRDSVREGGDMVFLLYTPGRLQSPPLQWTLWHRLWRKRLDKNHLCQETMENGPRHLCNTGNCHR